jgi:Arc/MetJ-type ribon-helix-helix transcriptional regulator
MNEVIILRINEETFKKLEYLTKYLKGIYPSKSQVIRSAIHRLYKEKLHEEKEILRKAKNI